MSKKSRLAVDDDYNHDRISNLHEDVLSHILSLLPTRDVFRTSVLSKQWRYKWRYSYTMDVDDAYRCGYEDGPLAADGFTEKERCNKGTFAQLMRNLLFFSQRLTSFSLVFGNNYDSTQLETWISTILKHNLKDLRVISYAQDYYEEPRHTHNVVFPRDLLNSTSLTGGGGALRKLNLHLACTINVAVNNYAANLTSLCLKGVDIVNGDNSSTLVKFSFPVLETLALTVCRWLNVKRVEIDAPSLTTFESVLVETSVPDKYSIQFNAPRLANFRCILGYPENYKFCKGTGGSSIVSAVFNGDYDLDSAELKSPQYTTTGSRIGKYINKFTNLEELELSDFISKILPLTCLRRHDKLRQLKLLFPVNAEILFQILHKAPFLKFLTIDMFSWDDDCDYEHSTLPTCILSHLEKVEIDGFDYIVHSHIQAAKFFMKKGEQLNMLRVHVATPHDHIQEARNVLSSLPRLSPSLTIEVC